MFSFSMITSILFFTSIFSCNTLPLVAVKIRSSDFPSCKNCIHYKPSPLNFDFTSGLNTCGNFGEKDIISDKIKYDYATDCRRNEEKCGVAGKEWREEPNMYLKIIWFNFSKSMIYFFPTFIYIYILSIKRHY